MIEIGTLTLACDVVMQFGDLIRPRFPHDHLLHLTGSRDVKTARPVHLTAEASFMDALSYLALGSMDARIA